MFSLQDMKKDLEIEENDICESYCSKVGKAVLRKAATEI